MKLDRFAFLRAVLGIAFSGLFLLGCATPTAERSLNPEPVSTELDILQVGNRITISVSDIPEPRVLEETIAPDGYVTLPFNKRIIAAGKTRRQLADEIHDIIVPTYFVRATVSIKAEDRFFSITGEVRSPNRYLFLGQMSVLKAIAQAGGFTEFAKKTRVDIIRPGIEKPIRVNAARAQDNPTKYDLPIYPNDHIIVRRRIL